MANRRCGALGVATMCVMSGIASTAWAQALPPDPAQLDYARPKTLTACPEEWYFRALVAGRFGGVDPFTPDAPRRIALTLGRKSGAFVVTLDMYDSAGAYLGGIEKPLVGPDCQRLVDQAGGIVVSWLVPLKRPDPPPVLACQAPPEHSPPAPCLDSRFSVWPTELPLPPLPKPKPDPPETLERWPIAVRLKAAVWTEEIAAGTGSYGFSGGIGARYHAVSLNAELHGDPAFGSHPIATVGEVSFARISGALLLCSYFGWFEGCGIADAGSFIFPDRVPVLPASTFYSNLGVQMALNFPVHPPRLFLHAALDLRAPVYTRAVPGRLRYDLIRCHA